jgi:OFA family oxalate/formate antiporter-like MFS transporter
MSAEGYINRWWRVVGALCMNLSLGSLYAWSIFIAPLEKEFGWNRADTSWIFTIAVFVFGMSFVIAGRLQDKLGPFKISVVGSIALAAGFILSMFTTTLPWILFTFGGVMGFGNGFGYATPIPVLSKWFPDRRGLAVGLAVAGYGGGSAILAFIGPPMLRDLGWRGTFLWLGIGYLVATMIGAFLLQNPPAGWKPEGWAPAPATAKVAATAYDYPPSEMVRTPQFPLMWIGYCLGASAGLMTISQLIPYGMTVGLTAALATFTLVTTAVGNAAGRVLSGWLSDAIGRLQTLRLMILVSALSMFILPNISGVGLVYIMLFIVYYCYGTLLSVFPSTTADFFGTKNLGVNYGWVFTAWGVAGIVGPMIGGYMFRTYKDYRVAFYMAGVLAIISLVCMAIAKKPAPVAAPAKAPA